jgi:hypothetical protein
LAPDEGEAVFQPAWCRSWPSSTPLSLFGSMPDLDMTELLASKL